MSRYIIDGSGKEFRFYIESDKGAFIAQSGTYTKKKRAIKDAKKMRDALGSRIWKTEELKKVVGNPGEVERVDGVTAWVNENADDDGGLLGLEYVISFDDICIFSYKMYQRYSNCFAAIQDCLRNLNGDIFAIV